MRGDVWAARLVIAWQFALSAADGDGVCQAGGAECDTQKHYWSRRGGNGLSSSFTPHAGPDISRPPAWEWANPNDEMHRHGPAIDAEGFIYTVTAQGWVRKFSQDGEILWSFRTGRGQGRVVTCLSLYNSSVHFMSTGGNFSSGLSFFGGIAWALSMETGEVRWQAEMPKEDLNEPDSQGVLATEGVFLAGLHDGTHRMGWNPQVQSTNKVVALAAADGSHLWDYYLDGQVWNFNPSAPGDGSVLFATNCGRAYRVDLQTGQLIWKAPFDEPGHWCSTGGGALGPDGRYYVATSHYSEHPGNRGNAGFEDIANCYMTESGAWDCVAGPGLLLVYRVDDGEIVLKTRLAHKLNQYPAVGRVNGKLAVVVAMGENPALAHWPFGTIREFLSPPARENQEYVAQLYTWQYKHAWFRRLLGFRPWRDNYVVAFDAQTLEPMWGFRDEAWDHYSASGDEENFLRRLEARRTDFRLELMCGPDAWSIPLIAGDGTVYVGSGMNRNLYALRDTDGDGQLGPGEVSTFEAGSAFLNAPALAPGLLAVASCSGPMYVFRDKLEEAAI